jgi:hypothetical protein
VPKPISAHVSPKRRRASYPKASRGTLPMAASTLRVGDTAGLKMPRHHDRPVVSMAVLAVLELGIGGCHSG